MPKILLYITAKVIWNFLFWNTDYYENRAHVHVGKKSTEHLCKKKKQNSLCTRQKDIGT